MGNHDCEQCVYTVLRVKCLYQEQQKYPSHTTFPRTVFQTGDADNDGETSVKDVYYIRLIAARLITPTEEQYRFCDVDGDGKITAIDANILRKYIIGMITELPVNT